LQGAVTDSMPPGKHLLGVFQQLLAGGSRLASTRGEVFKGAPHVRPAHLPARQRQMSVGGIAVGSDDGRVVVAQQLIDHLTSAVSANGEDGDPCRHRRPQPSLGAALSPTGLVHVDRRLLPNVGPGVGGRCDEGRRYFLFQLADRTQAQVHAEGIGQQRDDVAFADPVGARKQANPGLHAGAETPARHTRRPGGFGQGVAVLAAQRVTR